MPRSIVYIGFVLVVAWIAFRIGFALWKQVRRRREARPRNVRCPRCGSTRLDDYSDARSGYCLECGHVWGVGPEAGEGEGGQSSSSQQPGRGA